MSRQIGKDVLVCGISSLKVRDLLRQVETMSFTVDYFAEWGQKRDLDGRRLLTGLLSEGYLKEEIEGDPESGVKATAYSLTNKGVSFAHASGASRITRKKAEVILSDLLARVKTINKSELFIVEVTEVVVFGSYLSDQEDLGDIDLACSYESKLLNLNNSVAEKRRHQHLKDSKSKARGMDQIFWPWKQVLVFLKNGNRNVSLHDMEELETMVSSSADVQYRVLLGDATAIAQRCGGQQSS